MPGQESRPPVPVHDPESDKHVHLSRRAVLQAYGELLFELVHVTRDGRLGHVQPIGGGCEAAKSAATRRLPGLHARPT